ncbi:AraC-type DNA-binding protein [Acetitomaculum ruminis DSM 5522]|uniref:AraC-type DNA-binding protein n=1 Tax=Acetitomaculum ruminis DSM 5522 TaxID=1120918 RepID=A0A1I0XI63_9FIRM|nr:AraC family transcriptional regulator [Acetitomaculum ruminis]SFB00116.1 AraC-type DNA-binding protein [Acetitomaculum ruminis DSM 5522]
MIKEKERTKYVTSLIDFGNEGKMKWLGIKECLYVGYIDIRTRYLPENLAKSVVFKNPYTVPIKINYCFHGRCEVLLNSKVTTFVVGDEFAIDYGFSNEDKTSFFYPSADYEGIELIIYPTDELNEFINVMPGYNLISDIIQKFNNRTIPFISIADKRFKRCLEDIKEDIINSDSYDILVIDIIKLLLLLEKISFENDKRRTFCTPSQVEIAKKTLEIITKDLSVRYPASKLALSFGISETSLKNYIKAVFGKGYSDLVNGIRMETAAKLISKGGKSIGEIAELVGFQNQSRFSKAFYKYHKILPMEYKRRNFLL